jgi:hypothetical protein
MSLFQSTYQVLKDFLIHVETMLRTVLVKFIISQSSLVRILEVAKHLHLRIKKQSTPASLRLDQNRIIAVVLEIYSEALRRKSRIFPSTLAAMAEVYPFIFTFDHLSEDFQAIEQTSLYTTEYEKDLDSAIVRLGIEGIAYLQTRNLQSVNAETEVNVSLSIAILVLHGWKVDPEPFHQLFSEQASEVRPEILLHLGVSIDLDLIQKFVRPLSLNTWNILLLAALSHKSPGPGTLLIKHFASFVITYGEALSASSSAARGVVNAAANINHCYASVKLWLLLERMLSQSPETADVHVPIHRAMPFVIWNELWTPFSDLISAYEVDVSNGQDTVRAASHIPQTACVTRELRHCGALRRLSSRTFFNF